MLIDSKTKQKKQDYLLGVYIPCVIRKMASFGFHLKCVYEVCTWVSCSRSLKPSRTLRYFLSLYFLRMNVARCSAEAPL